MILPGSRLAVQRKPGECRSPAVRSSRVRVPTDRASRDPPSGDTPRRPRGILWRRTSPCSRVPHYQDHTV